MDKEVAMYGLMTLRNIEILRDMIYTANDLMETYMDELKQYADEFKIYFSNLLGVDIEDVQINRYDRYYVSVILIVNHEHLLDVYDLNAKLKDKLREMFDVDLPILVVVRW